MSSLPTPGDRRVSDHELRALIEQATNRAAGAPRTVVDLRRRLSSYHSSFAIEELDVKTEDGHEIHLLFKDFDCARLTEPARNVRPAFVYDPRREIEVYRRILSPQKLGTAACIAHRIDEQRGYYWLVLEHVPGRELYQIGEFRVWEEVARWLARLHAQSTPDLLRTWSQDCHLLNYNEAYLQSWIRRAAEFSRSQLREARRADGSRLLPWLTGCYDRAVSELISMPQTFVHGEFYAANVLVQEDPCKLRICPVDWETAGVGPALVDLAALTAGKWSADERTRLADAYRESLPESSDLMMDHDGFNFRLACCQLYLATRWLGWSRDWEPPPEQQHDWVAESVRAAEIVDTYHP